MRCYKCGCVLSANDTCAKCGTDVSIYKKTARVSDIYYNKGLEKARVRDLSGAIETLKVSLMINKYNIFSDLYIVRWEKWLRHYHSG